MWGATICPNSHVAVGYSIVIDEYIYEWQLLLGDIGWGSRLDRYKYMTRGNEKPGFLAIACLNCKIPE